MSSDQEVCVLRAPSTCSVENRHRPKLGRQLTIADDECHPPAALLAKTKEVDTLIKAETAETGNVRPLHVP